MAGKDLGKGPIWLLATATVAGALVGLLLMWPEPVEATPASDPPSTQPSPGLPSLPVLVAPQPSAPPQVPSSTDAPAPSAVPRTTAGAPPPPPPSSAPPPSQRPAPSPSVRAPLSVTPAPRPAFPNQKPPTPGDTPGGLLGGGGLL